MKSIVTGIIAVFLSLQVLGQSVDRDKEMGKKANEQLDEMIGLYEHSSLKYLDSLGQKLVEHIEEPTFNYKFGILDMEEPNAMALPGGYIYVSRGILVLANSEDELAGVTGHEIIHSYKRHSVKSQNQGIFTGILQIPGAIVGAFAPDLGMALMAPFAMLDASYSRGHEKEADKLGTQLAASSGYDPEGLKDILESLSKVTTLETGEEEQKSFFSTHPYTPKRIEDLDKVIRKTNTISGTPIALNDRSFVKRFEGLIIGVNPAQGVFLDSLFLHPELEISMDIPPKWSTQNTPQAIGLISPDQMAQVVISLDDANLGPDSLGRKFANYFYLQYGSKPDTSFHHPINGNPAYGLTFSGRSGEEPVYLRILWMLKDSTMYKMVSISNEKYLSVLDGLAHGLHDLSETQKALIMKTVLQVVKAQPGETLEALSERTKNGLDLEYTYLINNLNKGHQFTDNEYVKIGVLEPYSTITKN